MKTRHLKGSILSICFIILSAIGTMAQTKMAAYAFKSGSFASNGQTQLWSSIGGFSSKNLSSGTTTLSPGLFGQGFPEIVLGIIEDIKGDLIIAQNLTAQTVSVKNSSNRKIASSRIINAEGRYMDVSFNQDNFRDTVLSFSTSNLKPGVYLLQLNLQGLPVTKKFLVQ